jgi:hypothetical protein
MTEVNVITTGAQRSNQGLIAKLAGVLCNSSPKQQKTAQQSN